MRTVYGSKLDSMWAGVPQADLFASWATELGAFDGEDIRRALVALRQSHPAFPPTLYEFRQLCQDGMRARIGNQRRLPAPRGEIDPRVRERISQMARSMRRRAPASLERQPGDD